MKTGLHTIAILLTVASTSMAATTIDWWQLWTDPGIKPTIKAMIAEFEEANPDIKVNLTDLTWANGHEKIVIAFAAGTGPDLVELGSDWIAQFAENGHLADLSSEIEGDSADYSGWSMATYKSKVWAVPWILGTRVLFANRDLLNAAGLDSNMVPVAFPEMKSAALRVQRLGDDIYGWGSNTAEKHRLYKKYMPFFWSYGAQVLSDEGRYCVLSSVHAVNALALYKELHDSCGYVSNQRGIEDAFLDGKIGFIISGDWLLKRIELEKRNINLVSTLIPGLSYPGKSFLGGEFLAVNEAGENKEAALKLARFITSAENQIRFCKANRSANPSSRVAQKDPYFQSDPHIKTFILQLQLAKHPPVDPDWVYMEAIIEETVEEALFGSGAIAEPLRQARNRIAKLKNIK